jgi:hypothetical protein
MLGKNFLDKTTGDREIAAFFRRVSRGMSALPGKAGSRVKEEKEDRPSIRTGERQVDSPAPPARLRFGQKKRPAFEGRA